MMSNSGNRLKAGLHARVEHDPLGERQVPAEALWGIHTLRAIENFRIAGRRVHPVLIHAYGLVKLACARTNRALGAWSDNPAKADAIERACEEMASGLLDEHILTDALAGGAGTSVNMNVNEVLANRARACSSGASRVTGAQGDEDNAACAATTCAPAATVCPLADINLHQSTNDTFPTALKLAAMMLLKELEAATVALQEALQQKEKQFAHVVKVGRTQYQDAVLTTLGREFSAYADAVSRDRWRIYKCSERLRVANLGGTAIGSGLGAPRQFIFQVVEELRAVSGMNFARAENLIDATQNADVFVEVSGILKAQAATLMKMCGDLRLLSSGPEAGLGEIRLPQLQAGSSIMPGKVNPVIPEAVTQAAMAVIGNDASITLAAASGSLELNPFLPLIADRLLDSIGVMTRSCWDLAALCIDGIEADEVRCRSVVNASTALVTALVPQIGYERASELAAKATQTGVPLRELAVKEGLVTEQQFDELTSPEAVCRLGHR